MEKTDMVKTKENSKGTMRRKTVSGK